MEIDESSIIGNNSKVYWMFGIIDRYNKDARVFTILNGRTKNKLLFIIKNNIYSNSEDNDNGMDVEERFLINTRIF